MGTIPNTLRPFIPVVFLLTCFQGVSRAQSGDELLSKALYLADLYNWPAATPLFHQAEQEIPVADARNRLYAHIGTLRLAINSPVLRRSKEIADLLTENQLFQHDDELRLFALTVKGDLDSEVDTAAARKDWSEVIVVSAELHNTKWNYRAEGELGFCDFYDGDIPSAQRRVAGAVLQATQAQDVGAEVFYLSTSAYGLALQNVLPETAMRYARKAIQIAQQNPDVGVPFIAQSTLVVLLANTGHIAEATKMLAELFGTPNLSTAALVNYSSTAASVAIARHDLDGAVGYFQRAIRLAEPLGETRTIADIRSQLASLYLAKGDLSRAEEVSSQAVDQLAKAGTLPLLPSRLDSFGQILIAEKKYPEALVVYDRAESIADSLVGRGDSLITKTAPITGANELYAHHFALLLNGFHDSAAAFRVIEQGRARALVDLMLSQRVLLNTAADKQIAKLRIEMAALRSPQAIDKQKEAIFLAEQAKLANPGLTVVAHEHFRAVSAEMMQKRLGNSEVLLEYILGSPKSYVVALTRETTIAIPLAPQTTIETAVQRYLTAVQKRKTASSEAAALFKLVLQPIPQHLRKSLRYTVIPDGRLSQLPFDALLDGSGYVLAKHIVSYAPSATTLYLLRTKQQVHSSLSDALLGVGGIPYEGNSAITEIAVKRGYTQNGKFSNLPNSEPEIDAALRAFPNSQGRKLSGSDATESKVTAALADQFGYVHLAVHAFASDDPDRAAIVVLSDAAKGEDGFIEASEIVRMHINSKLVVLSACETDVGPIQGQEGMATLSTAFLLAGSKSVVSTLWQIEDQPSLLLMKAFYQHLGRGERVADALTHAKRDVLAKFGTTTLPVYWAAYITQGSNAPPVPKHDLQ